MTRFPLTAIGACAAIIAAHALPIRASAEETRPDCIAMLDLITTCADQQAMTAGRSAMAARDTTGMNVAPPASNPTDTTASKDGTYPKYEAYTSEYPKYETYTSDPYGP